MKKDIDNKELNNALEVIANWFLEENNKPYKKPITMIDTNIQVGDENFRLTTHFAFWGREETPYVVGKE